MATMAMTPQKMQTEIDRLTADRDAQRQRAERAEAQLQQEKEGTQAVQRLHEERGYAQWLAKRRLLATCFASCAAQAKALESLM